MRHFLKQKTAVGHHENASYVLILRLVFRNLFEYLEYVEFVDRQSDKRKIKEMFEQQIKTNKIVGEVIQDHGLYTQRRRSLLHCLL